MSQTDAEFRANLIEVGRDAMGRNDGWRWWHPRHLARLLDFWEPLIRADERRRAAEEIERLTRWKAEAIEVLDAWKEVWKALGSPGGLGESKARASRAKVAGGAS